jgi:hypothetical protein
MKPEDKLREDILYWEEQEREAKETLRYTAEMLPRLREGLLAIQGNGSRGSSRAQGVEKPASSASAGLQETKPLGGVSPSPIPLTGGCGEQVLQALPNQAELALTPNQIVEHLAEYGYPYSRGAIDYNLRALYAGKKIDRVKPKRGSHAVWAYFIPLQKQQPVEPESQLLG